jgi:hypothetical protein
MVPCKGRIKAAIGVLFTASLAFSACAGHGSNAFLPPTGDGLPSTASGHAHPRASGNLNLAGPIVAKISGGFTMIVDSGCGATDHGHLHVFINAYTQVTGGPPAVGLYAQVIGTGSCPTSATATSVTITSGPPTSPSPSPSSNPSSGPSSVPSTIPSYAPSTIPSPPPYTQPTGSPIPLPSGQLTVGSTISALWSGGFTIAPEAYDGLGNMHIYTNSSTAYGGGSPKTGLYAQVTGTGPFTNFHAAYVALYSGAPGTVTVSGTATAATPYGFLLTPSSSYSSGSYKSIPVIVNRNSVVAGRQLVIGSLVKVVGTGAANESVLAIQVVVSVASPAPGTGPPTPAPIPQTHVLTADYLNGSPSAPAAAPYLTWAQTGSQYANAISAAGIKTQVYVDPNRTSANTGDPLYTSDETTFAHDCYGNRITATYSASKTLYVMNIGEQSMQSLFASVVSSQLALAHFDAVYEDDAGPLSEMVFTPFSAMPCNYSDSQWLGYGQAIDQVSPVPVIFNGLDALNGQNVSMSIGLLSSSNTFGGNYEDCYSSPSSPKIGTWVWQATENTELQVNAQQKTFECQLGNQGSAASETDARLYGLASFLLTYNPATSILWEEFATSSGLHVMPEEQLVALDPIGSAPSSVAALMQTGGSYGRQYGECFLAGTYVGSCAVVVNPNNNAVTFPFPQYTHTLVLSGSGVLDGGSASINGQAPPLYLPANEAAIVFP